jgi:hypothetical protein
MSFKAEVYCANCGHYWFVTIPDGCLKGKTSETAHCYKEDNEKEKITFSCPQCKTKSRVKWRI